jgi:hypothetical protein
VIDDLLGDVVSPVKLYDFHTCICFIRNSYNPFFLKIGPSYGFPPSTFKRSQTFAVELTFQGEGHHIKKAPPFGRASKIN